MPHKHTLQASARSEKDFDLAPNQKAKPLSVKGSGQKGGKKRKRACGDDTPGAFKRLMAMQEHMNRRKTGATDGSRNQHQDQRSTAKKTQQTKKDSTDATQDAETKPEPKKARGNTDPALNNRQTATDIPALQSRGTRLQRKIEKKVSAWRAEDQRIRQRAEADKEAAREAEEERIEKMLEKSGVSTGMMDDDDFRKQVGLSWDDERGGQPTSAKVDPDTQRGKKKRAKKEEDDWAVLKERRGPKPKFSDVVQAPPELRKVKAVLKPKSNGVPQGGLKNQADMVEARAEVIKRYREMMGRDGRL